MATLTCLNGPNDRILNDILLVIISFIYFIYYFIYLFYLLFYLFILSIILFIYFIYYFIYLFYLLFYFYYLFQSTVVLDYTLTTDNLYNMLCAKKCPRRKVVGN